MQLADSQREEVATKQRNFVLMYHELSGEFILVDCVAKKQDIA